MNRQTHIYGFEELFDEAASQSCISVGLCNLIECRTEQRHRIFGGLCLATFNMFHETVLNLVRSLREYENAIRQKSFWGLV